MNDRVERFASLAVAASAVVLAGAFVYQRFFAEPVIQVGGPPLTVSYVDEWDELLTAGRQIGEAHVPIQLVEFVDLECPGCRVFAGTLANLQRAYGNRLGVTLIHYPLPMHRSAVMAARVAECGVPEGKFEELVALMLDEGDSLHLNQWLLYGTKAGVRDATAFRVCTEETAPVPMIERGVAVGDRIGLRATPTVIINGWRFSSTPIERELRDAIEALSKGRPPPFPVQ